MNTKSLIELTKTNQSLSIALANIKISKKKNKKSKDLVKQGLTNLITLNLIRS